MFLFRRAVQFKAFPQLADSASGGGVGGFTLVIDNRYFDINHRILPGIGDFPRLIVRPSIDNQIDTDTDTDTDSQVTHLEFLVHLWAGTEEGWRISGREWIRPQTCRKLQPQPGHRNVRQGKKILIFLLQKLIVM